MKPLLTILFILLIVAEKTAGGNTRSNISSKQLCKINVNSNCLIKEEPKEIKNDKTECNISLSSFWDGKMLLL